MNFSLLPLGVGIFLPFPSQISRLSTSVASPFLLRFKSASKPFLKRRKMGLTWESLRTYMGLTWEEEGLLKTQRREDAEINF